MNQLVIRGATVVDGLGNEPVRADVAVHDGRISAVGDVRDEGEREIDAEGLTLAPGIVDLHTHYDAQITWDRTLSPSPSLGVTTTVMGNCGFGIAPAAPAVRDLILRNLSVVEGMDLDALRAGVRWEFETFGEYMAALRAIGPCTNVAVLAGHSVIRTAVMGKAASERAEPTAEELARMQALVAEAMDGGAIGFGASYSLNHSGYGGVPMPSTITALSEFDALVGAMGTRPAGIVQLASGAKSVEELEEVAARHGRAIFKATGAAMYNDQVPERCIEMFEACSAAQERGNPVFIQIPCQPLAFDFTLANAYPFFSHDGFSEAKAYTPEQLVPLFRDPEFRRRFRTSLATPRPGLIFQGNWERVVVAVPALAKNEGFANRTIAEIAAERGADPLDVLLDLGLEENLETTFIGQFLNVGDEGVARLLRHDAGRRRPLRRGGASDLHVRSGLRPAFPRPLGARARRVRPRRRGAPPHEPSRRSLRDPRTRAHRGRCLGRPAPVRPGHRRYHPRRTGRGSPGGRAAHDSPAHRGPWRVLQRRRGLRRRRLRHERSGAGAGAGPVRAVERDRSVGQVGRCASIRGTFFREAVSASWRIRRFTRRTRRERRPSSPSGSRPLPGSAHPIDAETIDRDPRAQPPIAGSRTS